MSFFLFGPRQTGKSTFVDSLPGPRSWKVNLLETEDVLKYSKEPLLFRKEAVHQIDEKKVKRIIIDEIQKVPDLLNEVQWLMGKTKCQFIMTGSSARKLKRGHANLLGGRALARYLHPFVYSEIKDGFDLDKVLRFGSLPSIYGQPEPVQIDLLRAYTQIYLKEEIQAEGIVRNLGGFARFFDLAASQSGELVSFSAIARECHLPVRTVQSYYEILEDTLIGVRLLAWQKSLRKRLVAHPKVYFFDTGVTNAVNRQLAEAPGPLVKGRLFEQWVILETYRQLQYQGSEAQMFFWRTNHGAEVDLLIEKHGQIKGAYEIKCKTHVTGADISGLRAFKEEYPKVPCRVVSRVKNAYKIEDVLIMPWSDFFEELKKVL